MNNHFLIDYLVKLKQSDDKGSIAKLKRAGSNAALNFDALSVIGKVLNQNYTDREIEIFMLVSSLFAIHPVYSDMKNFGSTIKALRRKLSAGQDSLDNRFSALLNSQFEDLNIRLRQIIRLVSSYEIPVNYARLISDLKNWDWEDKYVQLSWAKEYWTGENDEISNETAINETQL